MSTKSISVQTTSSRTATRRLAYFFRCGNKEIREHLLRSLFIRRAQKTCRTSLSKSPQRLSNLVGQPAVVSTSNIFHSIFFSATPFVALKIRRLGRGKRVLAKVAPLDRQRGERKSLITLSSSLHSEGAVSKSFSERLERELEVISVSSGSMNRSMGVKANIVSSTVATGGARTIREKRDELHRLAFQSRPHRWSRQKKNLKNLKNKKIV